MGVGRGVFHGGRHDGSLLGGGKRGDVFGMKARGLVMDLVAGEPKGTDNSNPKDKPKAPL